MADLGDIFRFRTYWMLLATYVDDNLFSGRQTQEQPLVHNDVQIEKMRYAKIIFSKDSGSGVYNTFE